MKGNAWGPPDDYYYYYLKFYESRKLNENEQFRSIKLMPKMILYTKPFLQRAFKNCAWHT